MDSATNQSDFDDASDLYSEQNTEYLKGLLFSVVNTIPVVEVECYHAKTNKTDIRDLEKSLSEAKERNKLLNQRLFEYFHENDQMAGGEPTANVNTALDADRLGRYRQLLLELKSLNDKTKNLKESTATQVDDLNVSISKCRENLSIQLSELQKTIETVAAEMRADNNTSLTNQTIGEIISRIHTEQNELSSERTSFLKYKNLFRDLRLKAPSFEEYGSGIGINDVTKTRVESESLNEQVKDKSSELKELREKFSLVNQELSDRIKNNELKKHQLTQSVEELEQLKRQMYDKRVRLSNLKHDHRKLLQELKGLQNSSPLTDNPALYLDYEKTMQSIRQYQNIINKYKVDLDD